MSDRLRFLLVLTTGMLLAAASLVIIVNDPATAIVESPIMSPAAQTTPAPVPSPAAPAADQGLVNQGAGPVGVPTQHYAPEPVQEIGLIEIPKIGLTHRTFHGITLRNIDRGPSHWPGTAMPGETGNTVFAGHRTTHGAPFRRIHELVPGDEIFFTVAGLRTRYLVTGHQVVTPKQLEIVAPTATPTATLFACHPPGSASYRYVIRAALAAD